MDDEGFGRVNKLGVGEAVEGCVGVRRIGGLDV